ncbi:cation:proton antiporter [Methanococcus voltae]|uniref:Kef-type K+ transport system membrane component KefB n=2 Tax=Methanococcus voltae TaxID=2188 RepID=A0A8J7RLT2_METVO|nr:cation:proton antiporter [Methanococcus voltae]MBP2171874.1 Kef-type K+ transport system membrane component KefB [Methanococcus voltae]MBP2201171.1 Kef-type K+ transport system membrane component KefB [Methanococcus voltae]MCS3921894.1 Kef-type K+ transport system membrane component KefB [Methanococcus voltae PS]
MDNYIMLFIVMLLIFIFPQILKRFNIPGITAMMLAGIFIGPYGLNLIPMSDALMQFGAFGMLFLMFLAGLEVDNDTLKAEFKNSTFLSIFSMVIPAIGGYFVAQLFGLDFIGSLIYAVIFSSHSVGIVYGLMDELNMIKSKLGTTLLSATVIVDLLSLIIVSIIVKVNETAGGLNSEIFQFMGLVLLYIVGLLLIIPLMSKYIFKKLEELHVPKIHFILLLILISIITGEYIGIHPIIGAFITGIAVSEELTKEEHDTLLNENLNAIGYGLFIPLFFLTVGMNTNISVLTDLSNISLIAVAVSVLAILKTFSGYISLRMLKYNTKKSFCGGVFTVPSLSTALVAATLGLEMGILPYPYFVAIVILSLITSTIPPIFLKSYVLKNKKEFVEE